MEEKAVGAAQPPRLPAAPRVCALLRCLTPLLPLRVCTGVPLQRMVAGVAMGLILEPDGRFQVLTDILGLGEGSKGFWGAGP